MQKDFKRSEPTGLTKGSQINLVPSGNGSTMYIVRGAGVVGRTTWEGKQLWDCKTSSGRWQATVGLQGPRSGKIRLAKHDATSSTEVKAEFEIKWESLFYTDAKRTAKTHGSKKIRGKVTTLHWGMNVRRIIKIYIVRYERVIRSYLFKQICPFNVG